MRKRGILLIVVMFLFSLTFISAIPPVQVNTIIDKGINIEAPIIETIKSGELFKFHIHAYNSTDGTRLDNTTTNCIIHVYDSGGSHIVEGNMGFDSNGVDFNYDVLGSNFSKVGMYAVLFDCQYPGEIGGFLGYGFEVSKLGKKLTTQEALLYFILAFGVLLLFTLSFYFMLATPYGNDINEQGAVIKVTKLKYVKLTLILLTWVLFTWFLNILVGLSDNFISLTMYYGFFGFMFQTMNLLALPLGVVIFVISLFEIIRDANIMGNIKKFGSAYK